MEMVIEPSQYNFDNEANVLAEAVAKFKHDVVKYIPNLVALANSWFVFFQNPKVLGAQRLIDGANIVDGQNSQTEDYVGKCFLIVCLPIQHSRIVSVIGASDSFLSSLPVFPALEPLGPPNGVLDMLKFAAK